MSDPSREPGVAPGAQAELTLQDAWKIFGHVVALRGAHLSAFGGEVLALVGDNGAGKSTMVKVLSGLYRLDRGTVTVRGVVQSRLDPRSAQRSGISTVFQDLALVETLDVATNMFLGQPIKRAKLFANRKAMIAGAAQSLQDLGVRVPSVRLPIGELSGGQRQAVAVARAVRAENTIVIMDEPTAALGVRETRHVGSIIEALRERGKAVILVSHDLEFVFAHADRIQVLRLGGVEGVCRAADTSREEIVSLITGLRRGAEER